jgi:hypothetical protein
MDSHIDIRILVCLKLLLLLAGKVEEKPNFDFSRNGEKYLHLFIENSILIIGALGMRSIV